MAGNERRTSPRKICALPLRFRVGANGHSGRADSVETGNEIPGGSSAASGSEFAGKALNLSERGVYFTCREQLKIGQPIEMYFTLPSELTGRAPESVRCRARVVHVDEEGQSGLRGIGACVERLETATAVRNWAN